MLLYSLSRAFFREREKRRVGTPRNQSPLVTSRQHGSGFIV